jgi:glycosyltransferase involved in cell wall biosynthesis
MDVFVIPSHQEGLCIAALEGMSCGVPVISTRCGGPEEYVINDKTGCLVDHDAKCLAEAIMKVLSDSQLRQTLGNNARSLVESKYSIAYVKNLFWTSFNNTFPSTVGRNSFRQNISNA